jgi:hypothetical protein
MVLEQVVDDCKTNSFQHLWIIDFFIVIPVNNNSDSREPISKITLSNISNINLNCPMVVMGRVGHLQAFRRKVSTSRNMASDDQLSVMECPATDSRRMLGFWSVPLLIPKVC